MTSAKVISQYGTMNCEKGVTTLDGAVSIQHLNKSTSVDLEKTSVFDCLSAEPVKHFCEKYWCREDRIMSLRTFLSGTARKWDDLRIVERRDDT